MNSRRLRDTQGRALDEHWKFVRRRLGALVSHGGGSRVQNHVIEPLVAQIGYARIETVETIQSRDQYAHAHSTFNHSSYKDAPRQCLESFDELQSIGLAAFTQKHDPYWNNPLNEALPQPVIDLPVPETALYAALVKSHRELLDFQATPAPAGSGVWFTEQPVTRKRKKGTKV